MNHHVKQIFNISNTSSNKGNKPSNISNTSSNKDNKSSNTNDMSSNTIYNPKIVALNYPFAHPNPTTTQT